MTNKNSFPSNKVEALTMLLVQQHDISKLTPKELVEKYDEIHEQIQKASYENSKSISTF